MALLLAVLLQWAGLLPGGRDGGMGEAATITTLQEDLRALQAADGRGAAQFVELAGQVSKLEERVKAIEGAPKAPAPAPAAATDAAIGRLRSEIDDLTTRLAGLARRVDALAARPQPASDRAAWSFALGAIRNLAAKGEPFAAELQLLRPISADPAAIDALAPAAAKGVPTTAAIAGDFTAVADAVLAATRPRPSGGWMEQLTQRTRGLVTVRPSGPVAGSSPEAVVSRMRAALDRGDLAGALAEREGLPEAGKAASAAWADIARARADLDARLAALAVAGPAGKAME